MKLKNKKVLVYGYGESGKGAIELLQKKKAHICLYDDNISTITNLPTNVVAVENLTENFLNSLDLIVVNPSVSKYSEGLKLASILNKKIISEIELAFLFAKGDIISITGSNGKSTTSSLIYSIFNQAGIKSCLVGNIGKSFSREVSKNNKQNFIVEVSSFQLETINKYNSKIACFLNFCENHLDRHFSIKEYYETKLKIFQNQKKNNFSILNYDDEKVKTIKLKSKTFYFSKAEKVKGTYVLGNNIYFNNGKISEKVISINAIKLKGEHNLENVLCAVLVCKLYGIKNEDIFYGVSGFYGLEHRLEFVKKVGDILFYNDSKSTTCRATLTALNCFKDNNVLLILGGSDKGFEYDELFENLPKQVKNIICLGEVKEKILQSAKKYNFDNITSVKTFKLAVELSFLFSKREKLDVVLLSPATASFDMFSCFEERGEVFKELVCNLSDET